MQLLLYYGAIPDHACKQGASALGISAQEGHEECVSVLLQYGANPLKSDHCGRTPYKLASKSNRTGVIKILENHARNSKKFKRVFSKGFLTFFSIKSRRASSESAAEVPRQAAREVNPSTITKHSTKSQFIDDQQHDSPSWPSCDNINAEQQFL
jgi:hypothetical protein